MSGKRVFDTRGASEEELEGVRRALDEAEIAYYETSAGNWGLGSAGLWVNDDSDFGRARRAIDKFQQDWQHHVRRTPAAGGIRWHRVPALLAVLAAIFWVLFMSFRW